MFFQFWSLITMKNCPIAFLPKQAHIGQKCTGTFCQDFKISPKGRTFAKSCQTASEIRARMICPFAILIGTI